MEYTMLTEVRTEEAKKIRRETGTNPQRAKKLVPRKDGLVNALQTSPTNDHFVLAIPKSINMQLKSTKGTSTMTTKATQQTLTPKTYPILNYLSEDFLARLSALLENVEDLTTPEAHSSLIALGS